jgi:hypothetical protein
MSRKIDNSHCMSLVRGNKGFEFCQFKLMQKVVSSDKRKRGSYLDLPMCTLQAENVSMIFSTIIFGTLEFNLFQMNSIMVKVE